MDIFIADHIRIVKSVILFNFYWRVDIQIDVVLETVIGKLGH